jgi:hypothetical protein
MGISLNGLTPAGTYPGLIKTGDNTAISGTPKVLSDGNGNNLPMEVSTTGVNFTNNLTQGGTALQPVLVSGTNIKTINGATVLGSGDIVTPFTPPSGVSGAIQFSTGSAFGSDASNLFWDDTNNRLGVGTNAPSKQITISTSTISGGMYTEAGINGGFYVGNYTNGETFVTNNGLFHTVFTRSGNVGVGTGTFSSPNANDARLKVKGSGSTSATTSLLVQNSGGSEAFRVRDDLTTTIIGTNTSIEVSAAGTLFKCYGTTIASIYGPANQFKTESGISLGVGLSGYNLASAILQADSTTKGFLPPRMTNAQRTSISSPAVGLMVYCTDAVEGLYINKSTGWTLVI